MLGSKSQEPINGRGVTSSNGPSFNDEIEIAMLAVQKHALQAV
jgi:hypothetical protein